MGLRLPHEPRFTLKTRGLTQGDLDGFVEAYRPGEPHERTGSEQFKRWSYEDFVARPGCNLDVWADVVDESVTGAASLGPPDVIAAEIIEEVQAGLALFAQVAAELGQVAGAVDGEPEDGRRRAASRHR